MFELRAYGEPAAMVAVSEGLAALAVVRHLSVAAVESGKIATLTADIRADAADAVLAILERRGVPPDDIVFTRLETITAAADETEPARSSGRTSSVRRGPGRGLLHDT